ncbi:hypothetical protein NMY22_g14622 [Coprinellus aureogranulatus]|nr:hypothetical protein NMY22_g14622 [Coprinellus aureogranulatus]
MGFAPPQIPARAPQPGPEQPQPVADDEIADVEDEYDEDEGRRIGKVELEPIPMPLNLCVAFSLLSMSYLGVREDDSMGLLPFASTANFVNTARAGTHHGRWFSSGICSSSLSHLFDSRDIRTSVTTTTKGTTCPTAIAVGQMPPVIFHHPPAPFNMQHSSAFLLAPHTVTGPAPTQTQAPEPRPGTVSPATVPTANQDGYGQRQLHLPPSPTATYIGTALFTALPPPVPAAATPSDHNTHRAHSPTPSHLVPSAKGSGKRPENDTLSPALSPSKRTQAATPVPKHL